jgi:hypothetical protein
MYCFHWCSQRAGKEALVLSTVSTEAGVQVQGKSGNLALIKLITYSSARACRVGAPMGPLQTGRMALDSASSILN